MLFRSGALPAHQRLDRRRGQVRRGVPAVGADDRLELGGHALDLGPDVDALVGLLGIAAPFDAGPALGPVEGDVALVVGDPLEIGRASCREGGALAGDAEYLRMRESG